MPESSPDSAPAPTEPEQAGARATVQDVLACYRLLLGREPDAGGLAHYRQRLDGNGLSVSQLAGEFLGSVEFARAHPTHKSSAPAIEVVTTCEGFRMHVDATDYAVGHTVARTGTYEPHVSATLRRMLRPGATFVDVGANIGWFSLLGASLVGEGGRVVAIEPNPVSVELLRHSAKDNGYANIDVLAVALAERPMAVALETDGSNGRIIPVEGPPAHPVLASFVVAARPLDELLDRSGVTHVDMVKIDVEGAEPMVLRGAERTLAASRPVLVTEFFPLALGSSPWGSATGYLAMLRGYGYRLHVITDGVAGDEGDDDELIMAMAGAPGTDHVDLLAIPTA